MLNDEQLEAELQVLDETMQSYQDARDKPGRDAQVNGTIDQLSEIAALTNEAARQIRRRASSRAAAIEL